MKLNADIGENYDAHQDNSDADLIPYIDQANIACGGHTGDGISMRKTASLARDYKVEIGAHPSYPDLAGFGRRSMRIPPDELSALLHAQIGALDGVVKSIGEEVLYVKPHGALYNDMIAYQDVFEHVVCALESYYRPVSLMMQATPMPSKYQSYAQEKGIDLIFEAFADRAYQANGQLVPRNQNGAVLNASQALEQVERLLNDASVKCQDGSIIQLHADSLCVHGDSPEALDMVQSIRQLLGKH